MKKTISLILSLIIAVSVFLPSGAIVALADETGVCGDNLTYTINDDGKTLTISGTGAMTNYNLRTKAPWYADYSTTIKTVVIEKGVTSIGNYAFYYCDALESIVFSGTDVATIGNYAFRYCSALKWVDLSNSSVTSIGNYAFSDCTSIDWLNLGVVETIGNYAFNGCTGTTYWLNIPETTVSIGNKAFYKTNFNYNHIYNPDMTIGTDAFGNGTNSFYARFFAQGGRTTTIFEYVSEHKTNSNYNWWYYCMNDNHTYSNHPVEATCTEYGYNYFMCPYCNADAFKGEYIAPEHKYVQITSNADGMFTYTCTECDCTTVKFSAFEISKHTDMLMTTRDYEERFNQHNYNGKADINCDGVVNTKDFKLIADAIKSTSTTDMQTTIDTATTHQTIDGFGTSSAWWSQSVGGWENIQDIIDLLYSNDKGIGLNIYRYNVGSGSKSDSTMYDENRKTYCFMNPDGTYNWDADANAMNALAIAKATCEDDLQVELFTNSAPIYMTVNGHSYSSSDANGNAIENLAEDKYDDYAQFFVTVAEHFIEEGYNVVDMSPINEPEWGWNGNVQDGCCWSVDSAVNFYNNYMIPAIKSSEALNGKVRLSVWECGQINHSSFWNNYLNKMFSNLNTYKDKNANIREYCDSLVAHSYWCSTADREKAAKQLGYSYYEVDKVRFTEYCQMTNDGSSGVYGKIYDENYSTNGMDIVYGLALADIIHQDLTILDAVEWNWWLGCSQGVYPDGLVYINYNNHQDVKTSKRLWCLGNFSKFIEEGAQRVDITLGNNLGKNLVTYKTYTNEYGGVDKNNYFEASAYQNPDGSVVVVYINNSDTPQVTTFNSTYTQFASYVTDELRNLEEYQSGDPTGVVHIPAKSVTTVVLK